LKINTKKLQPIKIDDLIRVGKNNDGGYIIPKSIFTHCDGLISCGINKDWSFEEYFLSENPKAVIHCYDHTLSMKSLFVYTIKSFLLIIIHTLLIDSNRLKNSLQGIFVLTKYKKILKIMLFIIAIVFGRIILIIVKPLRMLLMKFLFRMPRIYL